MPDITTTGKPMGNGIPVSGLLAKADVMAAFTDNIPYFNTFWGESSLNGRSTGSIKGD
ncbi:4-aminobutyrate aminotransferase-like enzyme [Acinetobacter sp. BIGb0196]|nr:4-aminobutyrate aminotransferase-like enzyme [Acinetobacter guillouiae]MCW2250174.1 4-aminobutyrate aminotransferase-like enzyme [Acinetobacter sp. BIGb0204]NII39278.1 4-aminobutyrate aminotransferase-like enzyme [Acinetobacter sp. BIGb0196]